MDSKDSFFLAMLMLIVLSMGFILGVAIKSTTTPVLVNPFVVESTAIGTEGIYEMVLVDREGKVFYHYSLTAYTPGDTLLLGK